ncbi:hypothetical protein GCM10020367_45040 [Streptomyces sannanensis]|uniref:DUF397 domain-containing protein n=1 Tax=Streptomyces sannanensis TaxID=285536 RepID=A0ABP6SGT5_9ACTN
MASNDIDLSVTVWCKSSYSNGTGGDCVEVAAGLPGIVPVRDSKTPHGPVLMVAACAWDSFITTLKEPVQQSS